MIIALQQIRPCVRCKEWAVVLDLEYQEAIVRCIMCGDESLPAYDRASAIERWNKYEMKPSSVRG